MSKHAQFVPTTTGLTAEGFAELFIKHVACRYGLPTSIISDRDPRWTSDFWRAVSKGLKTGMLLSSARHPQHDGQTEIVNKRLEIMLRAYVADDKTSWVKWLPLLERAYNATPSSSTRTSPFQALLGYCPRGPLDYLTLQNSMEERPSVWHDEADEFLKNMEMHRESARNAIARAQVKQADSYNKGRRDLELKPGDLVMINPHSLEWTESKGEGVKLVQRAIGPFAVQERINPVVYRLDLDDRYQGSPVFNIDHLRKYIPSPTEFGERSVLPDTRKDKPATEEYQVEKIVGHRIDKRKKHTEYLVRWKDYSPMYDLWLSAKDLRNAPRILFEYQATHGLR